MTEPHAPTRSDTPATAQTYGARDVANAPQIKAAIARRSAARGDTAEVAQWLASHFFRYVIGNLQADAPVLVPLDSLATAREKLGNSIPVWISHRLSKNGHGTIPQQTIWWIDPDADAVREVEQRLIEFLCTRAGTPLDGKLMRVNAMQALAMWEAEHRAFEARQLSGWREHQPGAVRTVWRASQDGASADDNTRGEFVEFLPDSPALRAELAFESQCMRHCVGQFGNRRKLTGGYGEHYAAACEQGRMRLFSYRTEPISSPGRPTMKNAPSGGSGPREAGERGGSTNHPQPRITISAFVRPGGLLEIEQIKGKQNRPPVAKYHADVLAFLQSLPTTGNAPPDALAIDLVRLPGGWMRVADIAGEADQLALFSRHPDKLALVAAPSPLVQWLSMARTPQQVHAPAGTALAGALALAGITPGAETGAPERAA